MPATLSYPEARVFSDEELLAMADHAFQNKIIPSPPRDVSEAIILLLATGLIALAGTGVVR